MQQLFRSADAGPFGRRLRHERGARIPVSVVTGFLGAGKTTLLNALLRDPELRDTAVLINEFGEIALDHLLVEKIDGDMMVLSSGCLCCNLRGDLITALEKLLRNLDNGRAAFKRVIVETTGLADPAPLLQTLMQHPYLVMRFRLDGVVTLVDAVNGSDTLDHHPEAVKQVAVADRIDSVTAAIGKVVAWLTLATVVICFATVYLRYAMHIGLIWLQELYAWTHVIAITMGVYLLISLITSALMSLYAWRTGRSTNI